MIQLQHRKEGFVCNAELPSSPNIRLPALNLWQPPAMDTPTKKGPPPQAAGEPAFPVIIQVYVGALTFLGLYFIYRCAKR
jgi:hypothetical protein